MQESYGRRHLGIRSHTQNLHRTLQPNHYRKRNSYYNLQKLSDAKLPSYPKLPSLPTFLQNYISSDATPRCQLLFALKICIISIYIQQTLLPLLVRPKTLVFGTTYVLAQMFYFFYPSVRSLRCVGRPA